MGLNTKCGHNGIRTAGCHLLRLGRMLSRRVSALRQVQSWAAPHALHAALRTEHPASFYSDCYAWTLQWQPKVEIAGSEGWAGLELLAFDETASRTNRGMRCVS